MSTISQVKAREVLDSRGNPTVEVEILLSDGSQGLGISPSGASTGSKEVVELRDEDSSRFRGLGVLNAINGIRQEITPLLLGRMATDQKYLDTLLIELDGTPNKSRLGGNALVAVSIALVHAAAKSENVPVYQYLGNTQSLNIPIPMMNILNGGKHADNSTDIQEFMVVPAGFNSFREALHAGVNVYHALKDILTKKGFNTTIGDEGGFAPSGISNEDAIRLIIEAVVNGGYIPGEQFFLALDVAANEIVLENGNYKMRSDCTISSGKELVDMYCDWVSKYPIISIEDGIAENDWKGWATLTDRLGSTTQIVGDDLYATNPNIITNGIRDKTSNAVLIKPNQIGTITESLEAIEITKNAGWGVIISHRSGESEDTTIADLAVGSSAEQLKTGAPCRGERTAKYNRLLRIEEELGKSASYTGLTTYKKFFKNRRN